MKTLPKQLIRTASSLLTALLLFTSLSVRAQSEYYSGNHLDKGFWKIQTDYTTRNTVIRFFNARNEPIYQETLHGKYVKLTKKNIRLFDQMLDRVVNNQLLVSQVKSYDLLASSDLRFISTAKNHVPEDVSSVSLPEAQKTFQANPLINSLGKLRVNFINPDQKRINIELTDEDIRTVFYNEYSQVAGYNRYFDVSHMRSGRYRLQLKGAGQTYAYWLTIDNSGHQLDLKPAR